MSQEKDQKLLWKIQSLWEQSYQEGGSAELSSILTIPSFGFHKVQDFDFTKSKQLVFSDDHGSYYGLKQQQILEHQGKIVYLCDNHNKMLVPMFHLYQNHKRPLDITHIDAHPDDAFFEGEKPKVFNEESLQNLLENTRISDFYDALSEAKVIGNLKRVTDSQSFMQDFSEQEIDLLSLDIDIFGPEGDFVDLEIKVKTIAQAWKQASVICIATSPGFINQDLAHHIINIFTAKST